MRATAFVRNTAVTAVALAGLAIPATPATAATGSQIVYTAKQYLGRPYWYGVPYYLCPRWFDCSAFTKYVYARHGIYLPRSSREQLSRGRWVSRYSLRAGDLVFFYSPVHHVGIYMGNNRIIHTWGSGGVRIQTLFGSYWGNHFNTARRIL